MLTEQNQFLSVRQFAKEIGVSKEAILKAIREGRIRAERVDSMFLIEKSQLSKWFEK